ncbi:MAG: hypothetical protein LIP12_00125 [Clostridiales bacterium]|nr:hypothetical protein [Clostridiales bacterium]
MHKYIDADVLKAAIKELDSGGDYTVYHFLELIDEMPAADVEPVKHGKWIKTDADFHDMPMEEFKCSVCGNTTCNLTDTTIPLPKFCDGCGSKMDGDSE